jgi:hypothetical protein
VWAHPDSDGAGDLSVANSFAKPFGKQHFEFTPTSKLGELRTNC